MQAQREAVSTMAVAYWAKMKDHYVAGAAGMTLGMIVGYVAANLISLLLLFVLSLALLIGVGAGAWTLLKGQEKP